MIINRRVVVIVLWLSIALFSDLQATTILATESVTTEKLTSIQQANGGQKLGIWEQVTSWIWSKHHQLHHALSRELRGLRDKDNVGWTLVLVSFLYGVLHAAGPGHGKVVLTTYLLTHRSRFNRGIAMGVSAALLQGITALLLVYGLIGIAGWLPEETETASVWAMRASFMLLAIVGLYLLKRAITSLTGTIRQLRHEHAQDLHESSDHIHGDNCGCRHMPSAEEIGTISNRHETVGVVFAIGLRPCSGAVLVLILASVMNLIWYGALAVIVMSLGTAITIVTLAYLAMKARDWASSVVAQRSQLWTLTAGCIEVLGGTLLLLLGLWLLNASFTLKPTIVF